MHLSKMKNLLWAFKEDWLFPVFIVLFLIAAGFLIRNTINVEENRTKFDQENCIRFGFVEGSSQRHCLCYKNELCASHLEENSHE